MELFALAGRVVLSLAVVLVLLWLAARVMRRSHVRSTRGLDVDVLARHSLAQRASVAVVKVGDRALVLGVTENRVELLSDQPVEALLAAEASSTELSSTELSSTELSSLEASSIEASTVAVPAPRPSGAATPARPAGTGKVAAGPLAGSALSPATWSKALDAVREMTVRK